MNEEDYEVAFQIIALAGESKSSSMTAIRAAKNGDFEGARANLDAAEGNMREAHKAHTALLAEEARGNAVPMNVILVHAQDHLTGAMLVRDLAAEFVDVHRELKTLRG